MRIFIYKLLFTVVSFYILFQLTFGLAIKEIKKTLYETTSQENISILKDKIRKELKNGIKKEKILNSEDALLINKFIKKISEELKM